MPISPHDTIIGGRPRSTATQWKRAAKAAGAKRYDEVALYIDTVFAGAPFWGLDPAMVIAQAFHETGNFTSFWWETRLNPAGMGITGDPDQNEASYTFADGAESAKAQMAHLLLYATGKAETSWFNPRQGAYRIANGMKPVADTLNDLTGKWAADTDYGTKVAGRGNELVPGLPDQRSVHDPVEGTPVAALPYILLVSGHRSYNDAGNPAEKDLTDDLGIIYTDEFRKAGFRADLWQRDLDKDGDPDDTVGGLDNVSLGVARHLATISGEKVLLDLHFNGAHSPVHAIVPDVRGLTTAYQNGAPADDTYQRNLLDRLVAAKWAGDVARRFGLSLYKGGANEPGIMLEGETGVGRQGFRLATMAATAPHRKDTVRCVFEHAGTDDWGAGRADKFRQCAVIAVDAVKAVYKVSVPEIPTTTPPSKPRVLKRTPLPSPFVSSANLVELATKRYELAEDCVQYASAKAQDSNRVSSTKFKQGTTKTFQAASAGVDEKGKPALFFASANGTFCLARDVIGE